MSLRLVLGRLRCRFILRARMLQRSRVALGSADTLGLCGVPLPRLTSLLGVRSLSNVRRRVQVTMVRDATGGAARLRVVAHVQIRLTHMTTPRRVDGIHLQDPAAVSLVLSMRSWGEQRPEKS